MVLDSAAENVAGSQTTARASSPNRSLPARATAWHRCFAARLRLRSAPPLVERARMVKDADEIQLIRNAIELGASLFRIACKTIRPGVREVEVAAAMEYEARSKGAEGMSFPTILAAGPRSAVVHGRASAARIPRRGFVVCDFGVILAGYCSDRTRTVHVGSLHKRPAQVVRRRFWRRNWRRLRRCGPESPRLRSMRPPEACCARQSWRGTLRIRPGMAWGLRFTRRRAWLWGRLRSLSLAWSLRSSRARMSPESGECASRTWWW